MDGTNSKIVIECASNIRSLAFLKRMNINVDYNKDIGEISLTKLLEIMNFLDNN